MKDSEGKEILSAEDLEKQFNNDLNLKKTNSIKLDEDIFNPQLAKEKRPVGRPKGIGKNIPTDDKKEKDLIIEEIEFDSEIGELVLNLYITKFLKSTELAKDKESEKFAKVMKSIINKWMPPESKKYIDLWNLSVILMSVSYSRVDFDKPKIKLDSEIKKDENDNNLNNIKK
jgi:hypothetical protein